MLARSLKIKMAEEAKRTKKVATVKNLKKWEAEFHCKFPYDLSSNKVYRIRCDTCCRFEGTIKSTENFSTTWITLRVFQKTVFLSI